MDCMEFQTHTVQWHGDGRKEGGVGCGVDRVVVDG